MTLILQALFVGFLLGSLIGAVVATRLLTKRRRPSSSDYFRPYVEPLPFIREWTPDMAQRFAGRR
jgi:hypothetical protein